MNDCDGREAALNALLDGELDGLNASKWESHLRDCSTCAARFDEILSVRHLLGSARTEYGAPKSLRSKVEGMLASLEGTESGPEIAREAIGSPGKPRWRAWLGGGIGGALAAGLLALVVVPAVHDPGIREDLVASHIRSLQADHLTDVATSNGHVVKPWFNGKIDFSPPVLDLSDDFPLVGGRLDYVSGKSVVALVYRRRLHTINLFIAPGHPGVAAVPVMQRYRTYNIVHWSANDLDFWAVSDLNADELELFARKFRTASPGGTGS